MIKENTGQQCSDGKKLMKCDILYFYYVEIGNIYRRTSKNLLCTAKKQLYFRHDFHLEKSGLCWTSLRVTKTPEINVL